MQPIDLNSHEYLCWHEAGHIIAAYGVGATISRVVVTPAYVEVTEAGIVGGSGQCGVTVKYSGEADSKATEKKYVACGGWAAEYILYRRGLILNSEKSVITQKKFLEAANQHSWQDKLEFFSKNEPIDEKEFNDFGIERVYPILEENEVELVHLWQEIVKKKTLNQKGIEQCVPLLLAKKA